jgi:hypothetical protein
MAKKKIAGEVPTNGAEFLINFEKPFRVNLIIQGTCDIIFHRWNVESIDEQSKSKKGSKLRKSDNIDSFVYRDDQGYLILPGDYLRASIINAAKFKQDPRSPRKSAMDLYKAGFIILNKYASFGIKDWDYVDRRRMVIQKAAITRSRHAINAGWKCEFQIEVLLPEYIDEAGLYETIAMAGKVIGLADSRPTYGRFQIVEFKKT